MTKPRKEHSLIELDYIAPKQAASRRTIHHSAIFILGVIISLVALFCVWASFAEIDVVTRGVGQVIASKKTQVIAHLEGGIVKEILVKEGDLVEPGQVLVRIDPTVAKAQYKTNREQYIRYLATSERLKAQLAGEEYRISEEIQKEAPFIAAQEMKHYLERKQQTQTQKAIAEDIILQKTQELEQEKAILEQAKLQLSLVEEELKMVSPLVAEQLISKREVLRLKRDAANYKSEIAKSSAAINRAQAAVEQAKNELQQTLNKFNYEDQEQLRDIKIKLVEEEEQTLESEDRVMRSELKSPIKGIVKEIKIKTIGGIARPGEEILNVVPFEDTLLVEANVLPSDVAFVQPNQKVNIKVTAYDYTTYGSLNGQLLEVSADTVYDPEQKKTFYKILAQTDKNYLVHKNKKLPIIPGMNVEVDILTGKRTVMAYLLKPFIRGFSESFKER